MTASIGMIETKGLASAWVAADMMVKFAYVDVIRVEKTGDGYVTVLVQGDLESVRYALDIGGSEAMASGELIAAHMISKPMASLDALLTRE